MYGQIAMIVKAAFLWGDPDLDHPKGTQPLKSGSGGTSKSYALGGFALRSTPITFFFNTPTEKGVAFPYRLLQGVPPGSV